MIRWLRRLLGLERAPRPARIRVDRYAAGTVVWGPVAFTDGTGVKDRPALVVGRHSPGVLLVLALSSQEKRDGRPGWYPVGSGTWDRDRRPSWVRLEPYHQMQEKYVRRVGGHVRPEVVRGVAESLTRIHGRAPREMSPLRD